MNLSAFLNRAMQDQPRHVSSRERKRIEATARTRERWLHALLVDESRAWLSLGEADPEALQGLCVMLTMAGFVHVYQSGSVDTPAVRVIRGALSAAQQCQEGGAIMTGDHVQAFSSACRHAREIIKAGTPDAIAHAAQTMRETVGIHD